MNPSPPQFISVNPSPFGFMPVGFVNPSLLGFTPKHFMIPSPLEFMQTGFVNPSRLRFMHAGYSPLVFVSFEFMDMSPGRRPG